MLRAFAARILRAASNAASGGMQGVDFIPKSAYIERRPALKLRTASVTGPAAVRSRWGIVQR